MAVINFVKSGAIPVGGDGDLLHIVDTGGDEFTLHMADIAGGQVYSTLPLSGYVSQQNASDSQYVNLFSNINTLPDSGRGVESMFYAADAGGVINVPVDDSLGLIKNDDYATWSIGAYFEHNNGSFGGTRAPLDPITLDFLSHVDRVSTAARYGAAFIISRLSMDNGFPNSNTHVGTDGVRRRYAIRTGSSSQSVDRYMTFNYWIKVETGSAEVRMTFRDDALVGSDEQHATREIIDSADGWVHVSETNPAKRGYVTKVAVSLEEGSTVLIALPHLSTSWDRVKMDEHTAPQY